MIIDYGSRSAAPELRDRFLNALEGTDHAALVEFAKRLTGCSNYLPSETCIELGLPAGSRYAQAASCVLARDATFVAPVPDIK